MFLQFVHRGVLEWFRFCPSPRFLHATPEIQRDPILLDSSRLVRMHEYHASACHRHSIVDLPLFNVQAKMTAKFATLKLSSEMAALESPSGLGMVKKSSLDHPAPHSPDSCQDEGVRGMGNIPQALRVCGLAYRLERPPIHLPASPVIIYWCRALILKSSPVCVTNQ